MLGGGSAGNVPRLALLCVNECGFGDGDEEGEVEIAALAVVGETSLPSS